MQSFNRPNLKYELKVKKPASINDEIVTLINQKFTGQSGIIYCLSRLVSWSFTADLSYVQVQCHCMVCVWSSDEFCIAVYCCNHPVALEEIADCRWMYVIVLHVEQCSVSGWSVIKWLSTCVMLASKLKLIMQVCQTHNVTTFSCDGSEKMTVRLAVFAVIAPFGMSGSVPDQQFGGRSRFAKGA